MTSSPNRIAPPRDELDGAAFFATGTNLIKEARNVHIRVF